MPTKINIRTASAADLTALVAIHHRAFCGFFLDRMGPAFLRGYYTAVLEYPQGLLLLAESDGQPLGFAAGFIDPPKFYRFFRSQRLRLLPAIALALLRRPWLIAGILRGGSRVAHEGESVTPEQTAELSSIASCNSGQGVGSLLLQAFIDATRSRGCTRISLTTDETGNDAVRAFYEKRGFLDSGRELRGHRRLVLYELSLS